jgi:phage virion morphogenesis protein
MGGVTFTLEFDDSGPEARLAELIDRLDRPIAFYRTVGEYLTEVAIPRNFASESAPDGTPWALLSPVTIARREKKGQTPIQILRATGKMQAEIVSQASEEELRVGSPAPQAAVLQFGAAAGAFGTDAGGHQIPWGTIPARPFLGLSAEDEAEILLIASDWLDVQ